MYIHVAENRFEQNYEFATYTEGDLTVVEDLDSADYAYASEVDERFEARRKGKVLGRFQTLDEAREFLDG